VQEIVIDVATADKLLAANMVVVKDAAGRVVGQFRPSGWDDPANYEIPADHGLTPEELASRLAPDAKTYTTAEVLAHLRSLK
jgi:hypothetical protein